MEGQLQPHPLGGLMINESEGKVRSERQALRAPVSTLRLVDQTPGLPEGPVGSPCAGRSRNLGSDPLGIRGRPRALSPNGPPFPGKVPGEGGGLR